MTRPCQRRVSPSRHLKRTFSSAVFMMKSQVNRPWPGFNSRLLHSTFYTRNCRIHAVINMWTKQGATAALHDLQKHWQRNPPQKDSQQQRRQRERLQDTITSLAIGAPNELIMTQIQLIQDTAPDKKTQHLTQLALHELEPENL